jgi:hypothetical protein
MKPDRILKIMPILTAYSEGKVIRGRVSKDHKFQRLNELTEDHINGWELEVEPDPAYLYVNKYTDGTKAYFDSEEEAISISHADEVSDFEYVAKLFVSFSD